MGHPKQKKIQLSCFGWMFQFAICSPARCLWYHVDVNCRRPIRVKEDVVQLICYNFLSFSAVLDDEDKESVITTGSIVTVTVTVKRRSLDVSVTSIREH